MSYVRGIDDLGKVHWLNSNANWGLAEHAQKFNRSKAEYLCGEINKRNLYLNSNDQIVPQIVELIQ